MDAWQSYNQQLVRYNDLGISVDFSQMGIPEGLIASREDSCRAAYTAMRDLEAGAVANVDQRRMVGHYWLRDAALAPVDGADREPIRSSIESSRYEIADFARAIHAQGRFTHALVVGMGGSVLGPQLVTDALGSPSDEMRTAFLDNTDPEGFARVLATLPLATTLTVVISKSGGTKETVNGLAAARAAYEAAGLRFADHAVAVTGGESQLHRLAESESWRQRFAMPDWVGGRTSVTGVVGLLPMALQGLDGAAFLEGARVMDAHTRKETTSGNAAMRMALAWHHAGGGQGKRNMVILPYKDRLALLAKYLQQLIMESLGKERDLDGKVVEEGITVYGNKGSTDQHAYVQQLRDGANDFFATFIEVRQNFTDGTRATDIAGDYLQGFLRGTRRALADKGRFSMTISLPNVDPRSLGALIALFERSVGYYAGLVNINAYHQPGVEAGKIAAEAFIRSLKRCRDHLQASPGRAFTAEELFPHISPEEDTDLPEIEDVYHGLVHMANNDPKVHQTLGGSPREDAFVAQA